MDITRLLVSSLTIGALLLASCASTAPPSVPSNTPTASSSVAGPQAPSTPAVKPAAPTPSARQADQPKYGGVLTYSLYTDAPSLDPHQENSFATTVFAQSIMNGVVEFDPNDPGWRIRPGLAEKWEIGKDGTEITFGLRQGVTWHDGKPFTSTDAKFSLERAGVSPPKGAVSPRKKEFEPVERVETRGDYTLLLTLRHAYAEIMDVVASGYNLMMPKQIVEPLGGAKLRKVENIVGTGPFRLKNYDTGVGWQVVKNTAYFRKGLPYLDEVRYYVIKDESTRFSALRTKRIMMDARSPGLTTTQKETLEKGPLAGQIVVSGGLSNSLWVLQLNTRHPGPIGDARVRKAIHLGVDRQRMQRLFAQTQTHLEIGSVISPASKFAIPKETVEKMPGLRQPKDEDIAEARRLLEESKAPRGFPLTVTTREGAAYRDLSTIIVEELKTLGIGAAIKVLDTASLYDVQERRDFAAVAWSYGSWSPSPHFNFGDRFVTGGGRTQEGVSDERLDSLYARQNRSSDGEERKKAFWEMERILREEIVPYISFFWATRFTAYWKEIKGYAGFGLGHQEGNNLEEVWLDK
ncbi:MAG: hypothetical protein HYX92_00160 [Chloroflexi bacterium]|nr:hypothetical protein [Chloroflexota bacterium]